MQIPRERVPKGIWGPTASPPACSSWKYEQQAPFRTMEGGAKLFMQVEGIYLKNK